MILSDCVFPPISPLPLQQAPSAFSYATEKAAMAKGRLPQPRESAAVTLEWNHLYYFDLTLNLRPHPIFLGGQGILVGFYWIGYFYFKSDRIRSLHKCQELIFILHWHLQKSYKRNKFRSVLLHPNHIPLGAVMSQMPVPSQRLGGASTWTCGFRLFVF